jgi:hypothetical protein
MRRSLVGVRGLGCGVLFVFAATSQVAPPKVPPVPPAPPPAVALLGEVDVHQLALGEVSTVFEAYFAAKPRRTAAIDALLLVRCGEGGVLTLRIDVLKMIKTGDNTANVQLRDGDLLLLSTKVMAAAARSDVELIDAVVREAAVEHWSVSQRARFAAWRLLSEKDAVRRHDLVMNFGKLAADGAVAVPSLAAALGGDVAIARDAATALGLVGAAAAAALPELRKHAEGKDAQLRECCKAAIRTIEKAAKPVVVPPVK